MVRWGWLKTEALVTEYVWPQPQIVITNDLTYSQHNKCLYKNTLTINYYIFSQLKVLGECTGYLTISFKVQIWKPHTNYIWKSIHSSMSLEILPTKMVSDSRLRRQIKYSPTPSTIISRLHNRICWSHIIWSNAVQKFQQ